MPQAKALATASAADELAASSSAPGPPNEPAQQPDLQEVAAAPEPAQQPTAPDPKLHMAAADEMAPAPPLQLSPKAAAAAQQAADEI